MTRKNLISLIIIDFIVIIFALGLLAYRYQALTSLSVLAMKQDLKSQPAAPVAAQPQQQDTDETGKTSSHEKQAKTETAAAPAETRNISFTYKNSKAKKVEVIGDFTDWVPKRMDNSGAHTWKLTIALAPGDYAYNYVVNGKPRRDPNNPKVCNAGRGFTNSFLKVKPLSNDNNKAD